METDSKKTEVDRKKDSLRILDEVIKKESRRRKKEFVIISAAVIIIIAFIVLFPLLDRIFRKINGREADFLGLLLILLLFSAIATIIIALRHFFAKEHRSNNKN